MEYRSCLTNYIKYTTLNVLGMIGLSCYILADTFFVSKGLGAQGLAALNLAIPFYSFIHGSGLMLGMGGATRYSIATSQGRHQEGNLFFTNTLWIGLGLACVFLCCGLFFTGPMARLAGANEDIFQMTQTYLRVILLFSPMFILNDILIAFVRNDGQPRIAMLAMLAGSLSNIFLDYLLIFPFQLGIFGAAFATGLAPVISMGVLSTHLLGSRRGFSVKTGKPPLKNSSKVLAAGFPSLVTEVSSGLVIMIFNLILLGLEGNVGVAAYGVIANLSLVVVAIFTGIAQGIQPLLSQAYGRQDLQGIQWTMKFAAVSILLLSILIYGAVWMGAEPVAAVFNSEGNPQMQQIAVEGLRLYFIAAFFVSVNIILSVFFTSTENPLPAHIVSILRGFVVIVPMAFFLSWILGVRGVWLAFPLTELLVALVSIGFLIQRTRVWNQGGGLTSK